MKKVLLLALAVICVSSLAYGQNVGTIDIFGDAQLQSCNVTAAGQFSIYVAQTNSGGSTAVAFRIDRPATMLRLGDTPAFPLAIGDSDNGIGVVFNTCLTGTFLVLTVSYFDQGTAGCEWMTILGDLSSTSQRIGIVDCDDIKWESDQAGQARVNPDGSCQCAVPVEETTWGGIKSLYQD
jgi:hypothetical protein